MSLRAKRAALTAKVVGSSSALGGVGDGNGAGTGAPATNPASAGGSIATAPIQVATSSTDTVAAQREKLDKIAASFSPTIIGGHQAKQPPSYIFEESVRRSFSLFLILPFVVYLSTSLFLGYHST